MTNAAIRIRKLLTCLAYSKRVGLWTRPARELSGAAQLGVISRQRARRRQACDREPEPLDTEVRIELTIARHAESLQLAVEPLPLAIRIRDDHRAPDRQQVFDGALDRIDVVQDFDR